MELLPSSCTINVNRITSWRIHYLRCLGVEHFQPSLKISGKLCISCPCICSSRSVQISDRTCHRLIQTSNFCHAFLGGGFLASHCFQHVGRFLSSVSHGKRYDEGCFGRLCFKGYTITVFNIWLLRDMLHRQEFSSAVCHVRQELLKHLHIGLPAM